MGLAGCSAFLQPSLAQSLNSSSCHSLFLFPFHSKVARRKRASAVASFWNGERSADDCYFFHRRVVLLVGVSVLPLLQLREVSAGEPGEVSGGTKFKESYIDSRCYSVLGKEVGLPGGRENELKTEGQSLKATDINFEAQLLKLTEPEIPSLQPKSSYGEARGAAVGSSFVSFLNAIGIIGSGVFGALFAASQQEKKALESTIDSMKELKKDDEITTALLKKNFETRLQSEREEHQNQLRKFKNEEASLSSELNSAKDAVTALGRELQDEKRLAEELNTQIHQLENSFTQARDDKKLLEAAFHEKADRVSALQDKLSMLSLEINEKENNFQVLQSLLAERESECKKLCSNLEQARDDLVAANSSMEQLKDDIFKAVEESNSKDSIIDDLHAKIKSLTEEKDDVNRKFSDLMKDYVDLISHSERTSVRDSELLSEKNKQLQQLEENLKQASSEISFKETIISELTRERDNISALLEKEKCETYTLTNELQSARDLFVTSEAELSHLSKELIEAKAAYEEVVSKVLVMQDEFDQKRQLMNSNLEEARATSKILSDKLESAKSVHRCTEVELVSASNELRTVMEEREVLKKELVDTYKRVEMMTDLLKDERNTVTGLNKELEDLRDQILKDSEARRRLEADLDEATRSLDEMNKSALMLSREIEITNSRNSSLETEKEILYKSLVDQKNAAKEAYENIDDAKHFISRLGSEKEKLEKRSKRFEEELAASKGEILRLRRKAGAGQEFVTEHLPKSNEVPAGTPFSVKRNTGRRKKQTPGSNDSL